MTKNFIVLLTTILVDQMTEPDEKLYQIIAALKGAGMLAAEAIAEMTAQHLKTLTQPFDKKLKTAWMAKLCKELVDNHDSLIPRTPEALLALGLEEITPSIASTVAQEAFGLFYGPAVDDYYGCRMAIVLDLIDVGEYHFDKKKIKIENVNPDYVRVSLLTWLPQTEWKSFHKLLVSTAQILVEASDEQVETIQKVIKKKFALAEKRVLLGAIDSIIDHFNAVDG